MRLLAYNVLYGGHGREAALLEVVRGADPDVVVLPETTVAETVAGLARALGGSAHVPAGPRLALKVGLISRRPVRRFETVRWRPWSRPGFLAVLDGDRGPVTLAGVHLTAYYPWPAELLRLAEARALVRAAAGWPAPRILAGDFNAIAPGDGTRLDTAPLWVRLQLWPQAGAVPRMALRPLAEAGYVDAFRALHPAEPGHTLPPIRPQVRLDYVFADPAAARGLRRCEVVTAPEAAGRASDHFPVVADFEGLGAE